MQKYCINRLRISLLDKIALIAKRQIPYLYEMPKS